MIKTLIKTAMVACDTKFVFLGEDYMSRVKREPAYLYAKTKPQIGCAATVQLNSAFDYIASTITLLPELRLEKTALLHMRKKQRRRSASR